VGYRDDTVALESRCEARERDRDRLRTELEARQAERRRLEQEVRRKRWRLQLRRLLEWAGRHKLFVTLLICATLTPTYLWFRDYARRVWQERQAEQAMMRIGCLGFLQVGSEPSGAAVFVDDNRIGVTPLRQRVCPGTHLIRVSASHSYPWQQLVQIPARGELGLRAKLHSLWVSYRPRGTLVLSEPPAAIVFVNDRELGRTPAFIPEEQRRMTSVVSLVKEGYRPVRVSPRPNETIWFTLGKSTDGHAQPR
jgi:hypothetical protein